MKTIVEFSIIPIGVGVSLSKYIAACEQVLRQAGLRIELHANGTNIEGDWDIIMPAIKQCHRVVHEMGAPRISTTLKVGTRIDREQTLTNKVRSVKEKMKGG
ncbi:MTH1187 family thiamine-binding protein [Acidobacteria bacterium AH-259-O06]|nr:MTH1187 family thiamine-binding protein [Acidobacteria bacterium AH-259-O06]